MPNREPTTTSLPKGYECILTPLYSLPTSPYRKDGTKANTTGSNDGWPANDRIIRDILCNSFNISRVSAGPLQGLSLVIRLLERLSGYMHLTRLTCKPNEEAQKEGIVEYRSGGLGIPFLMVSCTGRKQFFKQWPTVEQLHYLSSIGDPTKWPESRSVKKDFPLDIVR